MVYIINDQREVSPADGSAENKHKSVKINY